MAAPVIQIIIATIVLVVTSAQNADLDSKIVTLAQGAVRGYKSNESEVFEFFGIPYATAPAGPLKFTPPLPAPTWTETLEAIENHIICPQDPTWYPNKNIQEDCLIANIFTPATTDVNLPVLVSIHGGGYFIGFGNMMTPRRLVETGKIVAVTFNYRLGPHGFLCLGTTDVPGNAGMKDQIALLRWVKNNIASFGGNPDDVTISGFSAGSSAVDLLMLSKPAEGLFNKVIPESGSNLGIWSTHTDPVQYAKEYARLLNFSNVDDPEALEAFYKSLSYDVLTSQVTIDLPDGILLFSPCIERDLGQERFLEDSPVNIIKQGLYTQVPLLYGFADMEGLVSIPFYDDYVIRMNEKFSDFLPGDLIFESEDEKETVAQSIKEFYFGNNSIGIYTIFDYIYFHSDVGFTNPMLRSAKMQIDAGHSSIYLYEYTFNKRFPSVPGVPDVLVNYPGAQHCAQTYAVYDSNTPFIRDEEYTAEYRQMKATMRELWLNFITTGQPVPEGSWLPAWPPAGTNRSPHMHLGETIELRGALLPDRAQLWDQIYERYYRQPIPPVFPELSPSSGTARRISSNVLIYFVSLYMIKYMTAI